MSYFNERELRNMGFSIPLIKALREAHDNTTGSTLTLTDIEIASETSTAELRAAVASLSEQIASLRRELHSIRPPVFMEPIRDEPRRMNLTLIEQRITDLENKVA